LSPAQNRQERQQPAEAVIQQRSGSDPAAIHERNGSFVPSSHPCAASRRLASGSAKKTLAADASAQSFDQRDSVLSKGKASSKQQAASKQQASTGRTLAGLVGYTKRGAVLASNSPWAPDVWPFDSLRR